MKTTTLRNAAAAGLTALVIGNAAAQESVSKPVGYETISIDQQFNYMGLRLVGTPLVTSTVATAAPAGDDAQLTLDDGTLEDGTVIIEVNDGDAAGAVVVGTVAGGTITTEISLLDNLGAGASVTIREPQTLASVFGATGGVLDGSSGPGAADLLFVPTGDGGFTRYYYNIGNFGGGGAGWRILEDDGTETPVDPASVNLIYTDGMIVQNRGANNSVVVTGAVKTSGTALALTAQFNYLSSIYPVGATLSTLFDDPNNPGTILPGTLDSSSGPGAADLVLLPEGAGFRTFYYDIGGFGGLGAGWKEVVNGANQDIDSTAISLDGASSMIIQNRNALPQGLPVAAPGFYSAL